jgi:hypothetical protein
MKTLVNTAVLVVLLAVAPTPCFALRSVGQVSKKEAKEMGMEIRAKPAGPDAVWVELEFKTEDKLKHFSHVELEIGEGDKLLVSYAALRETRSASGSVVVRFMANRAYLDKITLCVVAGSFADIGYNLRVKDFVELEKVR